MSILQMSFSAAVLIVVITVIRAIAINRIPKKAFLILWVVVVLRLLIPFSVPSPFSVYSFLNTNTKITEKMAETPAAYIIPVKAPTPSENVRAVHSSGISPEKMDKMTALPLWMITWIAGVVLCSLYFVIAYIRFYKQFQTSIAVKNSFTIGWLEEHKMLRTISVKQSNRITTPLTYGIFRPVIILPDKIDWTDEKQLRYILMHEYVHIKRFDTVSKLLLTAAFCIHWFNPLVWAMYILANRDLELTCDEAVVRHFGETVKSSYALTLLRLEEQKSAITPCYSGFSENAAKERILSIMKYKKSSSIATIMAVVLVVGTTTTFASSATSLATVKSFMNKEEIDRIVQENLEEELVLYNADALETLAKSYSEYGLALNQSDGRLYYKDQLVKCFSENYIEQIVYFDGDIDVNASIDSTGELIGIELYNRQEVLGQIKSYLNQSTKTDSGEIYERARDAAHKDVVFWPDFGEIWEQACDAVHKDVVFWPLPEGQKEADWNYTAWSDVWSEEWQKAEAGGYLEPLLDYVTKRLIISADNSGSWRNLYQDLYDTSVGLLGNLK